MDDWFLRATREAYDVLATDHTDVVGSDPTLATKSVDRAMLAVFAEWVLAAGAAPVADVGCGSGRLTRILADHGLDAFGVDLSPRMVDLARRLQPELTFHVGSMMALDIAEETLGGIVAYYSMIHVPWEHRSQLFAEFHRCLAEGGYLLVTFQVGDERGRRDQVNGAEIPPLDWFRQQPDEIARLLVETGFDVRVSVVREPELGGRLGAEKVPQALLLARKTCRS